MSAKSFPINTSTAEKLELDTNVLIAPAHATHLKSPSRSSILSPSKSPLTREPLADVQPNTRSDIMPLGRQQSAPVSIASAVVKMLEDMGVQYAFGVSEGVIAPLWATLQHSSIQVLHFRHEAGAAFAAVESYFASGRPVVVFTTTGPGITNALTGFFAAHWRGAKVIFLSGSISASQRGRWAFQETSTYTMPNAGVFTSESLFDYATTLECGDQLPEIFRRIALGLARPGGFVAHLSIPTTIQTSSSKASLPRVTLSQTVATASSVSTAVRYQIPAVWIVLNDARYKMCEQGMALRGFKSTDETIPQVDFVRIARGSGRNIRGLETSTNLLFPQHPQEFMLSPKRAPLAAQRFWRKALQTSRGAGRQWCWSCSRGWVLGWDHAPAPVYSAR